MDVSLTPELERRIAEKVQSGLYPTASEVVREGLRLLFAREEAEQERTARWQTEIQEGLDELDRGELLPLESAFAEARARVAAHRQQQ